MDYFVFAKNLKSKRNLICDTCGKETTKEFYALFLNEKLSKIVCPECGKKLMEYARQEGEEFREVNYENAEERMKKEINECLSFEGGIKIFTGISFEEVMELMLSPFPIIREGAEFTTSAEELTETIDYNLSRKMMKGQDPFLAFKVMLEFWGGKAYVEITEEIPEKEARNQNKIKTLKEIKKETPNYLEIGQKLMEEAKKNFIETNTKEEFAKVLKNLFVMLMIEKRDPYVLTFTCLPGRYLVKLEES